eukprot:Phypoly_transcript_07385.p1 GENE.Phypoly_transcript_07385~~Phypoly_transcript_07385.p1  ORF type:complete len:285 (+),score=41.25 Phypoly_transcript_07385:201-1055(+)
MMVLGKENSPKKEKDAEQIAFKEELSKMIESLQSSDSPLRKEAITKLRRVLSAERDPPTEQVIAAGVIPIIIQLLKDEDWELQFEATWALTNIVSGSTEHTRAVLQSGAVPVLIELLTSEHIELCEQAISALGNIAGDSVYNRNFVLDKGVMPALLKLFSHEFKTTLYINATWALSNLVREKPPVPLDIVQPALPILANCSIRPIWMLWPMRAGPCHTFSMVRPIESKYCSSLELRVVWWIYLSILMGCKNTCFTEYWNIVAGEELQPNFFLTLGVVEKLIQAY